MTAGMLEGDLARRAARNSSGDPLLDKALAFIDRNLARSDLAPALREILDKTEVGHLTAPETTAQGVELFALCEKKETKVDTPEKQQIREKIFSEEFQSKATRLLKDLRRQAMNSFSRCAVRAPRATASLCM